MGSLRNQNNWLNIACDIYRYQNFKMSVAAKHIRGDLAKATKETYFQQGCYYLTTGKVYNNRFPISLVKALKKVKKINLEILIPNKKNSRKDYKPRGRYNMPIGEFSQNVVSPAVVEIAPVVEVAPAVELTVVKNTETESLFGVKCGETIYLMKNKEESVVFMKGVKALKDTAGISDDYSIKIVELDIKEICNEKK